MKKLLKTFFAALLAFSAAAAFGAKTKVACVGDSITYGYGIEDRPNNSYPAQLGRILGDKYEVVNFGVSGTTAIRAGNFPYASTQKYEQALNYQPDIVVIKLGTNDSKAVNIAKISDFAADVKTLIASFKKLPSKPKVYLCLPVPAYINGTKPMVINGDRIISEIIPQLKKVAADDGEVELVDLFTPLSGKGELFPDKIHPNAEGASIMAKIVAEKIREK